MTGKQRLTYWRILCDRSFFHFVRIIGGAVGQGGIISQRIHGPLCAFAQSPNIYRKGIGTPRDWLKSTVWTKWKAIYDYIKNPEERQLIASENERIAGNMLLWVQTQILRNPRLRLLYEDRLSYVDEDTGEQRLIDKSWTKMDGIRWTRTAMDLPNRGFRGEPSIQAIGIGGAAQSGHYTRIKIDDLVGEAAMKSPLVMDSCIRWFDNHAELLVQPDIGLPDPSYVEIVGTHWGPGDFFCYVQDNFEEFKWMIVPCRKDWPEHERAHMVYLNNTDVEVGESNWPEKFSTQYYIDMLNSEKANIYWAQHMNFPEKGAGVTKIDPDWIRYYEWEWEEKQVGNTMLKKLYIVCVKDDGTPGERFRTDTIDWFGFIDPGGFSDKLRLKKSSRNAVVIGGQPVGSIKKFVVYAEAWRFKNPKHFLDKIFTAHEAWNPRSWKIDTVGTQPYIFEDIILARKTRKVHFPISSLEVDNRKDSKDSFIEALIPPFSNGEIYLHRSMKDLIGEIKTFPGGMTRDLVEMLARLYDEHMVRKEKSDIAKRNLNRQRFSASDRGRNPVTMY